MQRTLQGGLRRPLERTRSGLAALLSQRDAAAYSSTTPCCTRLPHMSAAPR